jgi:outer membrane protein assembly factor BamE (lipoprotein component of BamABCDE complex)
MKKTSVISLLAAASLLGLCGCASNHGDQSQAQSKPAKDKRSKADRLKVGMTLEEVREACGNPRNTAVNSDGSQTWIYNDAEKAFIPYYAMSGGKFHNLVVVFGTDGKVKSWSSNTASEY